MDHGPRVAGTGFKIRNRERDETDIRERGGGNVVAAAPMPIVDAELTGDIQATQDGASDFTIFPCDARGNKRVEESQQ
jgi:hypothetical protein